VNELAKMPITKLQMRLIIKELEALGFDDATRCDDKRAARAQRTPSMRSIDNLKDRKMTEYYLSCRILNDLLPNWGGITCNRRLLQDEEGRDMSKGTGRTI